jgi:hypothetical protein
MVNSPRAETQYLETRSLTAYSGRRKPQIVMPVIRVAGGEREKYYWPRPKRQLADAVPSIGSNISAIQGYESISNFNA